MATKVPVIHIAHTGGTATFEMHTMEWIAQNRVSRKLDRTAMAYFVMVWISKGSGIHYIDLEKYGVADNTI